MGGCLPQTFVLVFLLILEPFAIWSGVDWRSNHLDSRAKYFWIENARKKREEEKNRKYNEPKYLWMKNAGKKFKKKIISSGPTAGFCGLAPVEVTT